jgi:hypothetical protein
MDLQQRRKLIEEGGLIVDDSPKSPKTEETRLVSKAEMMDGLLAKDYGTTIQNEQNVEAKNTLPEETEKSDEEEKENPFKDTLEDNVGVIVDDKGVTVDNVGVTVDNVGVTVDDVRISVDNLADNVGDNSTITVDNRGDRGGGNEGSVKTDVEYCELDEGEDTELYSKENISDKEEGKKKMGEIF